VLRPNGVAAPSKWPVAGSFRALHGIPREAKLVLFLGRLSTKKSPALLLNAFAKLPERLGGNEVHLSFTGPDEGGLRTRLEQMSTQLGLSSRVHFTAPVFGEAKWSAYRDADVFVLPSQNENFGNTAAEAMASGTPVIVTEQCGIAPMLKDRAGLVVPHDAGQLANALARLLTDRQLRDALQRGCEAVTAELGWSAPVSQMVELYGRLIAAKPPAVTQ
jgi:glycosyltransferase involved in cell wall biosynthesis